MNEYLVSTPVKADECPKCHESVLTALVNGFAVVADPIPKTASEEVMLRLEGVRFWQSLSLGEQRFELMKRTAWHITKGDARARAYAEHRCTIQLRLEMK